MKGIPLFYHGLIRLAKAEKSQKSHFKIFSPLLYQLSYPAKTVEVTAFDFFVGLSDRYKVEGNAVQSNTKVSKRRHCLVDFETELD